MNTVSILGLLMLVIGTVLLRRKASEPVPDPATEAYDTRRTVIQIWLLVAGVGMLVTIFGVYTEVIYG